ncbi:MAG: hypothetical protein WBF58_22875 [Xanthobacteraceae bacterium]
MHRLTVAAFAVVASCIIGFVPTLLLAHDDGRFADSPLKAWFDQLASGKGLCCSFADGISVADPDWGTERVSAAGRAEIVFWVVVDGKKLMVPTEAVVTAPNRFGPAVVWPYQDVNGVTQVRCFMPGPGA